VPGCLRARVKLTALPLSSHAANDDDSETDVLQLHAARWLALTGTSIDSVKGVSADDSDSYAVDEEGDTPMESKGESTSERLLGVGSVLVFLELGSLR
jgi:hypothetical protein